jgi:hypothetical protein
MSAGSVTAAMTRTGPAQRGQYLKSIANTRRRRCIQVMGGVSGPNLADAGNRLNPDWVYARIENPQHWDPKTWMPRVEMSHKKRALLTLFISSMKSKAWLDLEKPDAVVQGPAAPFSVFVTGVAASGSEA